VFLVLVCVCLFSLFSLFSLCVSRASLLLLFCFIFIFFILYFILFYLFHFVYCYCLLFIVLFLFCVQLQHCFVLFCGHNDTIIVTYPRKSVVSSKSTYYGCSQHTGVQVDHLFCGRCIFYQVARPLHLAPKNETVFSHPKTIVPCFPQ
jgi:hypothetical protein